MTKFEQVARVQTDELDGDEFGNEWRVNYYVFETEDDDGATSFDLYVGDEDGNSKLVCRGRKYHEMVSLASRLGTLVEYAEGVRPK